MSDADDDLPPPKRSRARPTLLVALAGLGLVLGLKGCGWWYLEPDPNLVATHAQAPRFALPAASGSAAPVVSLDTLRAAGHVVLVFYRGRW